MKFFYKSRGTISVFLTIILVPVLIFGGMTTDAARISMSKVVISDAGEMAMNAGLAQYNEELHDEYGLLVMKQSPESMKDELKKYFDGSLNGTGLDGTDGYKKILDLLTENFKTINVQGSEIYQTEVEKQQILEYMKYRAPVCLTELVVDKLKELKNTKKMAEAMKKQMEFGKAMEDCQDKFQKAKEALDTLDGVINSLESQKIEKELAQTEEDYKYVAALALLLREGALKYDERLSQLETGDMKASTEVFLLNVKYVDLANPLDEGTYNAYLTCMKYKNTIDDMGGIGKLLESNNQADQGEDTDNTGTDSGSLEKLKTDYERELKRIKDYPSLLLTHANACIDSHYQALNVYWNSAKGAEQAAKTAYDRLKDVKKELEKAKTKFAEWDRANRELKNAGSNTESMDAEVEKYRKFFDDGNGAADSSQLESLMEDVRTNQEYFKKLKGVLEEEKFCDKSIATTSAPEQSECYKRAAGTCLSGMKTSGYETFYAIKKIWSEKYIVKYEHADINSAGSSKSISEHPFYKRLQEYCKESNSGDSKEKQEANSRLEQSKTAGEDAKKADEYPDFSWSTVNVRPSSQVGNAASQANDKAADLDAAGDVGNSSARRNSIDKFGESIDAATSFLDKVDEIVTKGLENLYIAEYAMQMFSYYTVNKEDGQERAQEDIIGISGYKLSNHAAYQAEGEYILWGKDTSKENIKNTVMMIFGIRLLFNSFFAFTDTTIGNIAGSAASIITSAAPYLEPIVKVVILLGFAGVETADDINKIKQGYGVAVVKNKNTWATLPHGGSSTDKGLTLDYSEYLRVFLNISILTGNKAGILGRIADCIQANQPDANLLEGYTMIAVQAKVSSRTTFMRKISDWGENSTWGFPDDTYTISYQSILGY